MTGIYKIQSKIKPERCYIGSAVNVKTRWQKHINELDKNIHHSSKLQRHYNKYGKDDLIFSIITTCSKEYLIQNEQFFIDAYKPWFNIAKIAGNCMMGRNHSIETKKKMSQKAMGNKNSLGYKKTEEQIRKSSEKTKGRKMSNEQKQKLSNAHKGKKLTQEHIEKIANSNRGKKRLPDVGIKISVAKKGHIVTEETRSKLSKINLGKKLSQTHRENVIKALIGRKKSPETIEKLRDSIKKSWEFRKQKSA